MKSLFSYIIFFLFLAGCQSDDTRVVDEIQNDTPVATKILFIGNSHTYYNQGVAIHVKRFAESFDIAMLSQESAQGGFTLEDHLNATTTLAAIESEDWDIIVLQENTFRAAYEPEAMQSSISEFTTLLGTTTATVYLFQTWAYHGMPEMNPLLNEAYTTASNTSGYPVLRIGNLWNTFIDQHPSIPLHDGDQVHPAMTGTYLTSALFFKKLFNYQQLSSTYLSSLTEEEATIIQEFVSSNML